MKGCKIYFLMVVLSVFCILLTACGNANGDAAETVNVSNDAEITMHDIVTSNRTASILEQHDSVCVNITYGNGEAAETIFVDDEIVFTCYRDAEYEQNYIITKDEAGVEYFKKGDVYGTGLYVGDEWETDLDWVENLVIHEETTLKETITGTQRDGDSFLVATELTGENLDTELFPGYKSLELEYTIDAETKLIRSMHQKAQLSDGTEEFIQFEVSYDVSRPDMANELYSRAFQTENLRTVTVIVSDGADEEVSYSASVPKGGDVIELNFSDENNSTLYYDPECTQPVDFENANVDYETDAVYYIPAA